MGVVLNGIEKVEFLLANVNDEIKIIMMIPSVGKFSESKITLTGYEKTGQDSKKLRSRVGLMMGKMYEDAE